MHISASIVFGIQKHTGGKKTPIKMVLLTSAKTIHVIFFPMAGSLDLKFCSLGYHLALNRAYPNFMFASRVRVGKSSNFRLR